MKHKCAVFTICKDEKIILPIWHRYYATQFREQDMYILDHQSKDGSLDQFKNSLCLEDNFNAGEMDMAEKKSSDGIIVTCRKCGNWNIIHGSNLKTGSVIVCSVCGTDLEWQS